MSGASGYEFNVEMACEGCSSAVTRILSKIDGVESFDVSLENQKVIVTGAGLDKDVLLTKLQKWATAAKKKIEFVGTV
jgi:copper chaperone